MSYLSDKALEIIGKRYLLPTEKTWEDLAKRVGSAIGKQEYGNRFSQIINDLYFIPGGRINRNAGRERGSLFNCYNLPIGDSREEIGELFKNALILWGEGGGVGINFSTLRHKGATIRGVGGFSSGLVSFMKAVDGIAATIESGGQRRAASLGLCEVWHPEVLEFIKAKRVDGDISYFNISVGVNEEFIDAVRKDINWGLHFNKVEIARVKARHLWNMIMENMVAFAEPGLINMSNLQQNNSYYYGPITACNPCGEVALEDYGVCNLGSLVLPRFMTENGRVKWQQLETVIRLGVRFLDLTIDANRYSLERIKQTALKGRRIGLGVMGLADMLFSAELKYGSRDALDFIEKLFRFIRNIAYEESIKIASEAGAFPAFNSDAYCKAKFIKTLPPSLRSDIRKHGTRNVTLLAIAPTGTISLIPECTSSIEPLMYKAYTRHDRISERVYVHPLLGKYINDNQAPEWFVDSTEITPQEHIDTQIAVQKYTDGAVSKTINVPNNFKQEQLSELLLESIDDLKGVTVYRDGSRAGQIIVPVTDYNSLKDIHGITHTADPETVTCSTGTCEL